LRSKYDDIEKKKKRIQKKSGGPTF